MLASVSKPSGIQHIIPRHSAWNEACDTRRGPPSHGPQKPRSNLTLAETTTSPYPRDPFKPQDPGILSRACTILFRKLPHRGEIVANLFGRGLSIGGIRLDEPLISFEWREEGGPRKASTGGPVKGTCPRRKKRHEPRHRSARDERAPPDHNISHWGPGQVRSSA